jgi:hypothetical protein
MPSTFGMSKAWLDVEMVKRTRVAARTVFMGKPSVNSMRGTCQPEWPPTVRRVTSAA